MKKEENKIIKLKPTLGGFSDQELRDARKALKRAKIPKPWRITITNTDSDEQLIYEL